MPDLRGAGKFLCILFQACNRQVRTKSHVRPGRRRAPLTAGERATPATTCRHRRLRRFICCFLPLFVCLSVCLSVCMSACLLVVLLCWLCTRTHAHRGHT